MTTVTNIGKVRAMDNSSVMDRITSAEMRVSPLPLCQTSNQPTIGETGTPSPITGEITPITQVTGVISLITRVTGDITEVITLITTKRTDKNDKIARGYKT
jgi:hypothetical protein